MKAIVRIFFISILFVSCSQKGIDRLHWIEGNWKGHDQEIQYFENWKKLDNETMIGDSYVYQDGDTVFREKNKIEIIGGTLCYILSTPDTKEPLIYKMISESDQQIVFENKEHPFPQVITYEMKGELLHVLSTGIQDKQKAKEEAYFIKK